MTGLLLAVALPCLYWTGGPETAAALKEAGIERICVAPQDVASWEVTGVAASPLFPEQLAGREAVPAPGILARPGLASPTRSPWVTANGWRFLRNPSGKYVYELPARTAALAAAEAFAYEVDAVLKADAADLRALGGVLALLRQLPPSSLPPVADFAVVDDGSAEVGEVLNLLVRRNLLFDIADAPSSRFPLTVQLGTAAYPRDEAADPSAFALAVRRQLTDERRSLRIYGSEVVIARLTADARRVRLHLLNYGGREIEGLRVRVRGAYRGGQAYVAGAGQVPLDDHTVAGDATEFSLPRMGVYAVVDLTDIP